MKKILIALAMLAFGASALQQARADVSVDYFYDNLSGGNWIDVEGYGYGWQPDLAVNDQNWRPYADGYWAYTDDGWTWISYEDFGWATYHYGRWANLSDYGWVWFPGEDLDWGPAWVSWRTGGDYVGWAPLPPRGPGVVYEGRPIGPQVDIEFDIGPEYYNFCEVRYIGEPVLRNYIAPPVQNVTYINNTVNVTNITVKNNVVYNYGPNYEALSAHSNRPIQRLNIERQSATNLSAAAKSGALTKVQGNKLVVAAPPKFAKAPPTAKPPAVKTKVAQPKLNRGWAGVPNEAQLKQKIKTENPKNVPPPTAAAARGARSPHQQLARVQRLRRQAGRRQFRPVQKANRVVCLPDATGTPPGARTTLPRSETDTSRTTGRVSPSPFERGKGSRADPAGRPQPGATTSPAGGAGRSARRRLSELRRRRLNMASQQEAGSARPPNLGSLVAPQTLQSKGAVKLSELSVAEHRRQPVPVRVSVAAAQSEDNRATANLARHLAVQVPARREAEKSAGNLAPINLQPRRLPVQVRAKREADQREGKVPMVNLPASQKAERQLRLSKGKGNRSAERKKARGLHRRGHNNLVNFRSGSGAKFRGRFLHKHDSCSGSCVAAIPVTFAGDTPATTAILRSAPRLVPRL